MSFRYVRQDLTLLIHKFDSFHSSADQFVNWNFNGCQI